ncbi:hypothetical protein SDC9_91024 [bioreactor metagenome]|uniref:PIN domain-containing protein n=1 Tax=bioreactor metagenome TaxID=1076179 RepID=A0A644ZUE1_9ZZZZ
MRFINNRNFNFSIQDTLLAVTLIYEVSCQQILVTQDNAIREFQPLPQSTVCAFLRAGITGSLTIVSNIDPIPYSLWNGKWIIFAFTVSSPHTIFNFMT